MCDDPMFEDIAAKIELTEWGQILISPVSKSRGIATMRIAEALRQALGGHTMAEVGIATPIGVRAPDVAWCSDGYLSAHPEEMPLSAAPELCVAIVSASNALPKLREKAMAYVDAGAVEAWVVFPQSRQVEVYAREGRRATTSYPLDLATLLA
jgi:Uma2 family endonuclease